MQKLLLFLLLGFSLQLIAQTKLSIIYQKTMEVSGLDSVKTESGSSQPLFYLNLNETASEYFMATEKNIDGVVKNYPSGYLYKNLKRNTFTQQINDSGEYKYGDLISMNWVLKPETKKILGYAVKKAVLESASGKQITAWYSNIRYRNGPDFYQGLPGLILEIEEIDNTDGKTKKILLSAVSINLAKDRRSIHDPLTAEDLILPKERDSPD